MEAYSMKRCPNCDFPNIDTDRACFKCNAALDSVTSTESNKESEVKVSYPTEEEETLLIYGNTVPYTNTALEDLRTTAEVQSPIKSTSVSKSATDYITPPPTTPEPSPTTPTRIIPKYRSFSIFTGLLRILSCIQGAIFIILGVLFLLWSKSLIGIVGLMIMATLGISSILIGFILSYILTWFSDVECNQRKQLELLNHIFHKISK